MRRAIRLAILLAAVAALSPIASAYYYWVYFAGRTAPFTPIPARYDLTALSNSTIPYLIQSSGPAVMVKGDTFNALISQIRLAAGTWNTVSTSAIKLSFGGLSPMTQPDSAPEVDVVFDDDIPPGLLAYTQVTMPQDIADPIANGAAFIPMINSRIHFWNDLTMNGQASYSDGFFLTIVHEFGHALGLQHTLTSSVMSTQITSAVTKSIPLAADDIAGISLLYPANGYPAGTGSITGTVGLLGAGVNLASVVALSTSGTAVSAFSNPDGSYQIAGIPPGQYYVYVHPLPPPAQGEAYPDNVVPPQDINGVPFDAMTGFLSQFYGGTTDWTQTTQITVVAGQPTAGINFQVQPSAGPAIYGVTTYGYLGLGGQIAVGTPPLQSGTGTNVVFYGSGIEVNNKVAPGLNVSVIGGTAQVRTGSLGYYASGYLKMIVDANAVSNYTPTALAMTVNGDLYVLPAAFSVVPSAVPTISAVSGTTDANGNALVNVAGTSLNANTKILFDGAPASLVQVNPDGSLLVAAPPASNGYHASVEVLSPDSQTSGQLLGSAAPPAFIFGGPASPAISVNVPTVTAGTDTMVQITGYNTNFVSGQTVIGFGSSDITVNQVWVVSPSLLQMNISVSPAAQAGSTTLSVASGLQLTTLSAAVQIAAANPGQITMRTPILSQLTGLAGVPAGGTILINTGGLPFTASSSTLTGWVLTIANQPTSFSLGNNAQLIAQVPVGLTTGPQLVQLTPANGASIPPVLVEVDSPAPIITGIVNAAGVAIGPSTPAHAGDTVTLAITGLADAFGNYPATAAIDVNAAGFDLTPALLAPAGGDGGATLQVTLSSNSMSGPQPVTVRVGTRLSAAYTIQIQ